jgi:hypothetical protein
MSFIVELSLTADMDLERLLDVLLDRAEATDDLDDAQTAIDAVRSLMQTQLSMTAYQYSQGGNGSSQG